MPNLRDFSSIILSKFNPWTSLSRIAIRCFPCNCSANSFKGEHSPRLPEHQVDTVVCYRPSQDKRGRKASTVCFKFLVVYWRREAPTVVTRILSSLIHWFLPFYSLAGEGAYPSVHEAPEISSRLKGMGYQCVNQTQNCLVNFLFK